MADESDISNYIKGLNFPATQNAILGMAKNSSAPGNILKMIKHLPKDKYMSMDELKMDMK